jgi:hypothetical protein
MARKSGKHATVTIGSYAGAELYNVEVRVTADLVDVTALDDDWAATVPGIGHWEVRAEKYYATEAFLTLVQATPLASTPLTVTVKDGAGTTVFAGTGYVTEGSFLIPQEAVTERLVIQGTGAPAE